MPQLDLSTLESWLGDSANILRGSIDSSDFKNYIFGLLFLKRVNDVFEEEVDTIMQREGISREDAEDETRKLFDLINGELNIVGWESKGMVINDIENKLVRYLKTKMERADAKSKAKELVEVLRNNKNV